jgi:hypothetical protein
MIKATRILKDMKKIKFILGVIVTSLCISSASAGLINLTLELQALSPGVLVSQPDNSGNSIDTWAHNTILAYNAAKDPDVPNPTLISAFRNNTGQNNGPAGTTTFVEDTKSLNILITGYEYLALHWGGPNKEYDSSMNQDPGYQLVYIGDPMGATHYTADNTRDNNGLSWYELFNPGTSVPDTGSTLVLLGLGLGFLGFLKRRK